MTIRKNDPNSAFWKAAAEASRRVDAFPPWKLGVLEPPAPPAQSAAATSEGQQTAVTPEPPKK